MTRVAVLDDYQRVAERMADWGSLPEGTEVVFFHDHLAETEALAERLRDFDVVVAMRERTAFPRALLGRLRRLRLLVTTGMRNAAIDLDAAAELGITVTGTDGIGTSTAELTWALILALLRHVPEEDAAIRAGGWQHTVGVDLAGRTLGVIGLGRIGRQVAAIGRAFGMAVTAWSQHLTEEAARAAGARRLDKLDLLAGADVVTVHLVLSERTRGLIGAAELEAMKPTAYLVNTSRGPIVDERALVAALRSGRIAGAALDVYETEPLPLDHPLRTAPNTVLTPHLGYVTEAGYRVFYGQAVEDIAAYLSGAPIRVLTRR
ncbi:MAG TPA: D-2-hydroxyacid dehydrogenase family protein [Candidatus Dormibacteraeota bacterium]|nr:D-2-hydroxyacid dehydrogenase family protein [Candidatus Dormibacteraeota bacterium]